MSIFFHVIILHDYRFFSEIRPIDELQDSDSSPRRGEVGRRTLRGYGGFLPAFFYRARFQLFAQQIPVFGREASKTTTNKPPGTSRAEESDSARKALRVR